MSGNAAVFSSLHDITLSFHVCVFTTLCGQASMTDLSHSSLASDPSLFFCFLY
jgi:hypothetical protein